MAQKKSESEFSPKDYKFNNRALRKIPQDKFEDLFENFAEHLREQPEENNPPAPPATSTNKKKKKKKKKAAFLDQISQPIDIKTETPRSQTSPLPTEPVQAVVSSRLAPQKNTSLTKKDSNKNPDDLKKLVRHRITFLSSTIEDDTPKFTQLEMMRIFHAQRVGLMIKKKSGPSLDTEKSWYYPIIRQNIEEITHLIKDLKVNINEIDSFAGELPFHMAISQYYMLSIGKDFQKELALAFLQKMLNLGVDLKKSNHHTETAAQLAKRLGLADVTNLLLAHTTRSKTASPSTTSTSLTSSTTTAPNASFFGSSTSTETTTSTLQMRESETNKPADLRLGDRGES